MLNNKIHLLPDAQLVARRVASLIGERVKVKSAEYRYFNLALSGGNTPNLLFAILADEMRTQIDWDRLRLFWVDERCVPPTDKESNYGVVDKLLLSKVPIPAQNIYRMQGESKPEDEALRYRMILDETLDKSNGLPQFDLILLGMGDDGHTASIFPNNLKLLHADDTVAVAAHPQSGQIRVSLTGNIICNACELAFVITGLSKAVVLEHIVNEKSNYASYPAYHILKTCDAELYVDNAAFSLI